MLTGMISIGEHLLPGAREAFRNGLRVVREAARCRTDSVLPKEYPSGMKNRYNATVNGDPERQNMQPAARDGNHLRCADAGGNFGRLLEWEDTG